MTPSEKVRVQECVQELSEILYRNTPSDKCQSFEDIEKAVREHLLESVGPEMAFFLSNKKLNSFNSLNGGNPRNGFSLKPISAKSE